jgi:hypothetical protein
MRTLLVTGTLVTLLTTGALYLGLRWDLGLPASIAFYAVGYNVLVVLVKFVLAPRGLYEINQDVAFEAHIPLDETGGALLTATLVFLLYAVALWILYRLARTRIARLIADRRLRVGRRRPGLRTVVLVVAALAVLLAGSGFVVVFAFLLAETGTEYLSFVFSSSVSLLVGLTLAGAAALASLAFAATAERARLAGDVALLASLFWLALAFLALYHVLWVVYVLVLTSIWPLKTVVPK